MKIVVLVFLESCRHSFDFIESFGTPSFWHFEYLTPFNIIMILLVMIIKIILGTIYI